MIDITDERYNELLEKEQMLCALECCGVDNWGGYSDAQDMVEEWDEEAKNG